MFGSSITSAATIVQPRQYLRTMLKYCAARFGFLNVGWLRWLASFQGLITRTSGQRLRNALNAFVYSLTVGSLHGFLGHFEPSEGPKLIERLDPGGLGRGEPASSKSR